jgi:hypothetical protein
MLRIKRIVAAAATAAVLLLPSEARADTTPVTTLVYNFTYSTNQNVTARDSSTSAEDVHVDALAGGSNGISHYSGSLSDKGTMTVQVIGKQQDEGLILTISETGQQTRRAPAATCVVYGNTRVICDPNKTVYSEEYTLLRFLGQNFVDPANIDAKRHWQITQDSPNLSITADYVIGPTTTSDVQVSEARKIRQSGGGSLTTDIQTKIGYDMSRTVPTTVD